MQYTCDFGGANERFADEFGARATALRTLLGGAAPVPPGFAISNVACRRFVETGDFPPGMWEEVVAGVARIEAATQRLDPGRPVLLAVRSSPPVDMPALLASALYIGLDDTGLTALEEWAGEQAAARARLGFLETYAGAIRHVPPGRVGALLGTSPPSPAAATELTRLGDSIEALVVEESQKPIPADRLSQLREAIEAVFASWDARAAGEYRRAHGIPSATGTAAIVHLMVFGHLTEESGVGVAYSRDPVTGAPGAAGYYRDQTAHPVSVVAYEGLDGLVATDPEVHAELAAALAGYEAAQLDMVRADFVRERGRLWIVDGRVGERSAEAATRVAVDLAREGAISKEAALKQIDPLHVAEMLHPRPAPGELPPPVTRGVAASPGCATGMVVLDSDVALDAATAGAEVILVKRETTPEDVATIRRVAGVLTSHGGRASHAALVARGIGTPAVCGAHDMVIDVEAATLSWGPHRVQAGDTITIDGATGNVYRGTLEILPPGATPELTTLLEWADETRRMEVWANADTPADAALARAAGAEGIGLARTEYMFSGDRLDVVQRILLTDDAREQADALEQLERLQVGDFERLLAVMDGLPVVVRLLDPPLHEFLPDRFDVEHELDEARAAGEPTAQLVALEAALDKWEESNPMLGLRGVRLAVVIPAVYRVQVLAALEAVRRRLDAGGDPRLELMIPLVGTIEELHLIRDMIEEEVHHAGRLLEVAIGTMIELPRACLVAHDIALDSDFFSFGTNDLTQTTLGLSRDDAEEAFLGAYLDRGLFRRNPFETIDPDGVGRLIRVAIEEGRSANPGLVVGVCGEHGADPESIEFFGTAGVDYVSCSPPRIPVARLAAAQAALRHPAVKSVGP